MTYNYYICNVLIPSLIKEETNLKYLINNVFISDEALEKFFETELENYKDKRVCSTPIKLAKIYRDKRCDYTIITLLFGNSFTKISDDDITTFALSFAYKEQCIRYFTYEGSKGIFNNHLYYFVCETKVLEDKRANYGIMNSFDLNKYKDKILNTL